MAETQSIPRLTRYEIHDVLRNERRTRVLEHLQQEREAVTLRELSEQLATLETGESPPPRNIRESVYNSLHQTHLPKLNDLGIVEYQRNRKLVTLADGSQQVNLYMETVPTNDITWATYYHVLGMMVLAIIGLSSVGVPAFTALSVTVWSLLFFGLFVLSALYQFWKHDGINLGPLRSSE
jgi:gamma-glutamylcyclotransferase (GGCT)/AIG2-like uncharacterized protein YtfP